MTLVEFITVAAGGLGTAGASFLATMRKVNATVGAAKPGEDSLRDLVNKIDGKLDAQHEATGERFDKIDRRLVLVEQRVFTPPSRFAVAIAREASKE